MGLLALDAVSTRDHPKSEDQHQSAPHTPRAHPNPIRTLELVKKDIESFALMFPGASFTLDDISKRRGGAHGRSKIRVLSVPKVSFCNCVKSTPGYVHQSTRGVGLCVLSNLVHK
ncbi:hypothetical protein NUW54_g6363 [Trametes sanguinea]|uniref:Uncharacterized protein n=1 Tax=Trametes sanguinea TaxID=158606 RepID=A0ACC1PSG9_9APHY|nr:hypothetical protein NUW54_g6363 [Trametes sanguinea]